MNSYGEDDLARIAELWARSVTTAEIGRQLQIPKNSVCRLARSARLRGDLRFPARLSVKREVEVEPQRKVEVKLQPRRRQRRVGRSKAPPAPIITPARRERGPFSVLELEPRHCRYPVFSGAARGDHWFCGEPRQEPSPYCGRHYELCRPQPSVHHPRLARRV